ncbi:MAG: cytochrome B [Gammaproteobacteria bacterium]|nr:cytochrome B [Gammaproteobacteria bacterium]
MAPTPGPSRNPSPRRHPRPPTWPCWPRPTPLAGILRKPCAGRGAPWPRPPTPNRFSGPSWPTNARNYFLNKPTDEADHAHQGTLVWDGWLRLFHWTLAAAVGVCVYTGLFGGFEAMDWHQWGGFTVLALVLFRLLWGMAGPATARFSDFLRGPGTVLAYLRALGPGQAPQRRGHNPLGGWAVVLILLVVGLQGVTGLFTTDDLFVEGPLYDLASDGWARLANQIHGLGPWTVGGVVGLHLLALAVHRGVFKERLLGAMVSGRRPEHTGEDVQRRPLLGGGLMVLAAGVVWAVLTYLP